MVKEMFELRSEERVEWKEHFRQKESICKGSVQETVRKLVFLEYRETGVV